MSNRIKDITGEHKNGWAAKEFLGVTKRFARWLCECQDCKSTKIVTGANWRHWGIGKCECQMHCHQSFIGKSFGKLKVIEEKIIIKNKRDEFWCLCECRCGKKDFWVNKYALYRQTKSCGCSKTNKIKNDSLNRFTTHKGYIQLYCPSHPNAQCHGMIFEHVYVMTKYLDRPLIKGETIHHKNGCRSDNRIENLELWASNHHPGQRAEDLLKYAYEIIDKYQDYHNPTKIENISPDWFEMEK